MLIRIVRMHFQDSLVPEFEAYFATIRDKVRHQEGCQHLELCRDAHNPAVFYTLSHWNSETDLNRYRDSPLFEGVWAKTKAMFAAKAQAYSLMTGERL
jgi:quinol monooxygenase YgiN